MKNNHRKSGMLPVSLAMILAPFALVQAATLTSTFTSQIIIQDDCNIVATANIDFGTHGVLTSNVDAAGAILLTCSLGASYDIGLDAGTTAGGTTITRKMDSGSDTVDYILSMDGTHATNWGNAVGTDTYSATGTGSLQAVPIFARVPIQTSPAAATYSDTITATVTF